MNDDFDFGCEAVDNTDYEQLSYAPPTYKRVCKLRKKAKARGIEVPRLNYELSKPEKPRVIFWIVAVISALIFVGILVMTGLLYNELVKAFSDLAGLGEFFKVLFDPDMLNASLGLSALPGILLVVVYILIAVLFILPLVAAFYFYRFVKGTFYMANCTKEEFAKGNIITSRIINLVIALVFLTVMLIVLLSVIEAESAKLYIGLIYGALVLALGGLLTLIIVEKMKSGKWFEGLDEYKKENYLAHDRGLRQVKSRLNTEKRLWRH